MTLAEELLSVADVYCARTGRARGTVSASILGRGSRLDEIASGSGDLTTRNFERVMLWFSANWPEGAVWPEGIDRPAAHLATVPASDAGDTAAAAASCQVESPVATQQGAAR